MSSSSYEQVRAENIKRNELMLEKLGLSKPKPKVVKPKAPPRVRSQVKVEVDPDYGSRRFSTRSSAQRAPGYFSEASQSALKRKGDDDSDDDYEDDEGEVRNYNDESIPFPTKRQRVNESASYKANKELALLSNTVEDEPVMKLEEAKTGRSSCRKCRATIDQGNMRVGMKAWIMGRSSWTWSHPACFTSLLALSREVSGRGKCKITSYKFDVNEVKVSATSHTNVINMCVPAAAKILESILREDPSYTVSTLCATLNEITAEEESTIKEAFEKPIKGELVMDASHGEGEAGEDDEEKIKITTNLTKQDQPAAGQKTGTKGQVAWKFAGHTCYGILISRSETETHCYAKTHKGNTKTLTKGGASWWLLG